MTRIIVAGIFMILFSYGICPAEVEITAEDDFVPVEHYAGLTYLMEPDEVTLDKYENSYVWVSDIEHVIEKKTGEVFLSGGEKPYYMCGDVVPGGKAFTLFPYHFYGEKEVEKLGGRISYRLKIKNVAENTVIVAISGMGTSTNWDNNKPWESALGGENAAEISLEPGEVRTLWAAEKLKGDLPWSAVIFGETDGDILVYDYAYLGDDDPGIEKAEQMPDLAWPPYLLASFTRGTAEWSGGEVSLFPERRDVQGNIRLSMLEDFVYSLAIGYSPGGPIDKLCLYKAVVPTFAGDKLIVRDPVSGKSHPFFGGNYPIRYDLSVPVLNDTEEEKVIDLYLCSNDKYGVDTWAGAWISGKFYNRRVEALFKNRHWKLLTMTVKPGEAENVDLTVVPLGGRWGGMILSMEVNTPND